MTGGRPALASGSPVSRLARLVPVGLQVRRRPEQVVALDVGDLRAETEPAASSLDLVGQPAGLSPPALVTTLTPRSRQVPSTSSIWVRNVRGVAGAAGPCAGPSRDQHGQLGQVVAGQHVDRAAVDHLPGGAEAGRRRSPSSWRCGPAAGGRHQAVAHGWPPASGRAPGRGPANAWAMASHCCATGPSTARARSSRCRRWVTSRQKSSAVPRRPGRPRRPGPRSQRSPSGRGQLDPDRRVRRGLAADGVAEGTRRRRRCARRGAAGRWARGPRRGRRRCPGRAPRSP